MDRTRSTARRGSARGARGLLAAGVWILTCALARADVVVLKDGRRIEGQVVADGATEVRVKTRFGELAFPRADVVKIERGKTAEQEFAEREKVAASADELYELGVWADGRKLRTQAKACMRRAIAVDPRHRGAHEFLGHVEYKGDWLTPEERDQRLAADTEAEMLARGLVLHEGAWVTPEDKRRLEQGLVLFDGRWMSVAEKNRLCGLEEFEGFWLPRPLALARTEARAVEKLVGLELATAETADAILAGPLAQGFLAEVGEGLDRARAWFDPRWSAPKGIELFGGRMAELYLWGVDSEPYVKSVPHFAERTQFLPEGWSEAASRSHGFVFWEPVPVSSARQWNRGLEDLRGHCYHHWGHILENRLGYDGKLLPPWYDEAVACLSEFHVHAQNRVLCRALPTSSVGVGTAAKRKTVDADPAELRRGGWRQFLAAALAADQVPRFDQIAERELAQLELVETVASMAIVEWLDSLGPAALPAFHAELRRAAPPPPERVLRDARARNAAYDRAFDAAAGKSWRESDLAWRAWFLSR